MTISDAPLAWGLTGCTTLAFAALLAVFLRSRRRNADEEAPADSWERSEERRRRKETVYGIASYVLLFCCAAVAAALSFHGLVGFGRQNLKLSGGWEYLVPFGLDGAAMFCSVLAVREASHGDAALGSRMLVWLFAGAAAWFNWVHAPRGVDHAGAPHFFAGMSLSAAILFDRALKQTRRAALREQGLVPRPLPQIRIVRWLRAPRETFRAWSLMLLENVRSLDEAVEEVREDKRRKEQEQLRRRAADKAERARIRAFNRQHRRWPPRPGGRQLPAVAGPEAALATSAGGAPVPALPEPAHATTAEPSPGSHRALRPVQQKDPSPSGEHSIDLTAEDDTLTLPRLDSLERKLKDLEQQFG
ncbi:hypothetical protein AQ490_00745 [Wenjunlia vitaminophila]|uniref:DUF2637 domain-containing protein n=1 Tax=Wenjunlia vitaminophila TaxID=76728 RepID=A0A0T6LZ79_WENVI|nr:DUF2637 domain-containing protein [Wenjunlia vitaminophila]KRV51329.1 hypothetical protein AQ490_00745 [Wenjunlia vitaminophila]